jgi:hypothetical protein
MENWIQTGHFNMPLEGNMERMGIHDLDDSSLVERYPINVRVSVFEWIKSLKIGKFSFDNFTAFFSDGVLLCKIINHLENNPELIKFYKKLPLIN